MLPVLLGSKMWKWQSHAPRGNDRASGVTLARYGRYPVAGGVLFEASGVFNMKPDASEVLDC